ncbi:MAG TPA: hypothetical protein VFX28_15250, partial [Methylomirabilota bacterium]|nr:hypothetical protein [Methylomirabilota bacterium]
DVLGVRLESGTTLRVKPCIPDDWPGFTVTWTLPRGNGTSVEIVVRNPGGAAATVARASLDGRSARVSGGEVMATLPFDGARHRLEIELGPDR